MCMGTICQTCNKQAWFGCGSHVASVFANIPENEWCTCEPKVEKDGKQYPPQAK